VNKLTTGSLVDKKPDKKGTVLTEEKLEEIGARLETSARKSLRRLAQACFESNCTKVTKLLTLRPYKTTVDHSLRVHDPVARINFCNWFLQPVHNGGVDPQLLLFSDDA
jgi:hypothetical protein